jgi:hypothetical protein
LDRSSLVRNRLSATFKIDDGKPSHAKAQRAVEELAVVIWATMEHRVRHRV